MASLFDVPPYTQCEALSPPQHVQTYWNSVGQPLRNTALNNDCVYIHYPPLADWVFGAMAVLGLDRVLDFKLAAIFVSCASAPVRAWGLQRMPASGLRVNEPPAWVTDFRMLVRQPSNSGMESITLRQIEAFSS